MKIDEMTIMGMKSERVCASLLLPLLIYLIWRSTHSHHHYHQQQQMYY